MKALISVSLLIIGISLYSCQKEYDLLSTSTTPGNKISELQYKWTLDSIIVYQNPDFTGGRFEGYIGDKTQYIIFNSNGKAYSYGGIPTPVFDTGDYKLMTDNYTLLFYSYINGVRQNIPDTATIRTLTSSSLVLGVRSPVNEYGKFSYSR